jgi:hypothetical protein
MSPGQEAKAFARLDDGPSDDDAGDPPGVHRLHRLGDGEVGLAGARGADGQGQGMGVDGRHQGFLISGPRLDRLQIALFAEAVVIAIGQCHDTGRGCGAFCH